MKVASLPSRRCQAPLILWRLLFILSAGAFLAPRAGAVLPPGAYSGMQRSAPELLHIEVTSVRQKKRSEDKDLKIMSVVVEAKVLAVQRTATRLKTGDLITIHYEYDLPKHSGYISENNLGPLSKGDRRPAYLHQRTDQPTVYEPAAGSYTFEKFKE